MTQVNWDVMKEFGREVLGVSPTRKLDELAIKLDSPASFLAALGFDNKPLEALKRRKNFNHFMISFIGVMDADQILNILSLVDLKITTADGVGRYKRDKLVVFTGTMDAWVHVCTIFCSENVDQELRECFNDVYLRFREHGFKHAFNGYSKTPLNDGTFILEVKC